MNSRATGRRIHELLKRFGRKERGRGYRVVTSSKRSLDPAPGALLSHMEQSFRPILTKSSPQPDEGIECSTSCARPPLSAVHSRESRETSSMPAHRIRSQTGESHLAPDSVVPWRALQADPNRLRTLAIRSSEPSAHHFGSG